MENEQFNTRAYNSIELLPFGLVKKSSTSDRLVDEGFYYDSIPSNIAHLFPRKKESYILEGKHHLVLEYYPYQNLGQYMISNDLFDWNLALANLNETLKLMYEYVEDCEDMSDHAVSMYINKTYTEYQNFKNTYHDMELFSCSKLVIDEKEYDNFEFMWQKITSIIKNHLLRYRRTMIHGDMCFSNILYHPKVGSRFIDMRGSFGRRGVYGDSMYDYAKLLHSVEGGYEYIINDCFSVKKVSPCVYNTNLFCNRNKIDALDAYMTIFKDKNIDLIRLVEGLIFIGMCARHYDNKERQIMMYLTGIKILNEALKTL